MNLTWTRTSPGVYVAGSWKVYAVDDGGWALTSKGRRCGKFRTAKDAKDAAQRWAWQR